MKVCGNCLHWTRCTEGLTQGICNYPLPYWVEYVPYNYFHEDNSAEDCECYNDEFFESITCDECNGSGTYYINKKPFKCICSEDQD